MQTLSILSIKQRKFHGIICKFFFWTFLILSISGCHNSQRNNKEDIPKNDIIQQSTPKPRVNVFIENGGSMDGFVLGGVTDFKEVIGKLLPQIKDQYSDSTGDNIHIYFIHNSKDDSELIVEDIFEKDVTSYIEAIEMKWKEIKRNQTRGNNTELNTLFRSILDSTEDNTISILISDCIYSIGRGEVENKLNAQKGITYDSFLNKLKNREDLETMIIQMSSNFTGYYYPCTGDSHRYYINNERLNYYICIVGNHRDIDDFNDNIVKFNKDRQSFKGFNNQHLFSRTQINPYYSVLLYTKPQNVHFKAPREELTKDAVHSIVDIETINKGSSCRGRSISDSSNHFEFTIAIDLSSIDLENEYLLSTSNYYLSDDNFKITDIRPIDRKIVNSADWKRISSKSPTHTITFRANSNIYSDVTIGLKRKKPNWITQSSTHNDTIRDTIIAGKTFALEYWFNGISDAYEYKNRDKKVDSYFEITIKIQK